MIPGTKNKNGSSWVTARHGGDGKGHSGPGSAPNPVNHYGAVNAKKSAPEESAKEEAQETPQQEQEEEWQNPEAVQSPQLHPYHEQIANDLQQVHGLNRNKAVRVSAGIVAKHAQGHAAVDADQQQQASQ